LTIFVGIWGRDYQFIRNVNIFLKHIDQVPASESVKNNLKGQMLFIREWEYAHLLNFFGGVPIITKVFKLNGNLNSEKRDSYQRGITWVVNQLNKAVKLVPKTVPEDQWGRITKGAVLALKSRVLLYAASKLHDPSAFSSDSLYSYDKSDKWGNAAKAAKAVMDLNQYHLVQVANWKDYQQMFLHKTAEIILARPQNSQFTQEVNLQQMSVPNGYGGFSGNCPTQGLVNAFQMKDGKSIEDSPLYNPSPTTIYKNRELRFYADIVYNGAMYRGRKVDFYIPGGKDSPDGPSGWNYARSGYTMRKHMDESVSFQSTNPTTPIIFFRLAGIYLNYAEAEYHLGNESIAREYVNKIRERVHLLDIHSSGKQLLKDIRHERRIELVFEGYNRFNDLRRWMLAQKYLSKNAKGIQWKKVDNQGSLSPNGKLTYSIITNQKRNFKKRMYFLPIPRAEIEKTGMKQNRGYK
jgi:hypothetical protein